MSDAAVANRTWSCLDDLAMEITAKDAAGLETIAGRLAPGTIVAVPYLPNQINPVRIRAAAMLRDRGFSPMPHIEARRVRTLAGLESLMDRLAAQARIDRLLIVSGDLASPEGPFSSPIGVLKTGLPVKYGVRTVAIAGYPEGHPKKSSPLLAQEMRDKLAVLADQGITAEIITQFSFSAAPVLDWLAGLRAGGIDAPVRLGIPGPASARTLLRYAAMCCVGSSASVLARYGLSLAKLMSKTEPDALVRDLTAMLDPDRHGRVTAHYFPFGGLSGLLDWLERQRSAL